MGIRPGRRPDPRQARLAEPEPRATGGRQHGSGWVSIDLDGGATLYLQRARDVWRVRAARQGDWVIEYPAWQVELALNAYVPAERGDGGAGLVCRHLGRELMHLLFVLRGPRSRALRRWPSAWQAMGGVISIGRRDAFYNWRRDDPMVFFTDCYQTVHDNLFKRES